MASARLRVCAQGGDSCHEPGDRFEDERLVSHAEHGFRTLRGGGATLTSGRWVRGEGVLVASPVSGGYEAIICIYSGAPGLGGPRGHCVLVALSPQGVNHRCDHSPVDSSAMTTRDVTLDVAKGIAIIAIVFGHVWRGLASAGIIEDQALYETVDTTVYMWHLAVFAFTAGLFVQQGMERRGAWAYARDRDLAFLWLYIVWSLIQGAVKIVAGASVNAQTSVMQVLQLWVPEGQLWFFGWIALMMVFAAAVQPWRSSARAGGAVAVAVLVSFALWGLNGPVVGTQGLGLTVYFVFALLWRGDRVVVALRSAPLWALGLVILVGAGFVWVSVVGIATPPTVGGTERSVISVALGFAASTGLLVAVLATSRLIAAVPGLRAVIAGVGLRSMAVFVAHIIFAAGARIALARAGVDHLTPHVILGTLAGVVGPLALHAVAARVGASWLFDAPTWLRVRAARRDSGRVDERQDH